MNLSAFILFDNGNEILLNRKLYATRESKVRNQRSFGSAVKFDLSDLAVGKLKRKINRGMATFLRSYLNCKIERLPKR